VATARLRRFRTLAEIGCRWGADPIADLQGGELIIGDVPRADLPVLVQSATIEGELLVSIDSNG
jgi:hypothetical protein